MYRRGKVHIWFVFAIAFSYFEMMSKAIVFRDIRFLVEYILEPKTGFPMVLICHNVGTFVLYFTEHKITKKGTVTV